MELQLKFVSKEEAHKLIDEAPGDKILVMTYNQSVGISNHGKYIKKKKGKNLVDKSVTLVLSDNKPIMTLNLLNKIIKDFSYDREDIVKTMVFYQHQLE